MFFGFPPLNLLFLILFVLPHFYLLLFLGPNGPSVPDLDLYGFLGQNLLISLLSSSLRLILLHHVLPFLPLPYHVLILLNYPAVVLFLLLPFSIHQGQKAHLLNNPHYLPADSRFPYLKPPYVCNFILTNQVGFDNSIYKNIIFILYTQ